MSIRFFLALAVLGLVGPAFAQSADQEVVSVVDSPDPVVPGNNITYTVTVRNNGPDAAVNGGPSVSLGGSLTYVSSTVPAGFTCFGGGASVSCISPSFAPGTAVFTIVAAVDASLVNFPDGTLTSNFAPSGTTLDPNNGNNLKSATTSYDSPQIDLTTTVTDSPDPVGPNQNITYSITVTNGGPDNATNVNFNTFNNGTLQFQSATAPAGFSCSLPAVNGTPTFSCNAATLAPGTYPFTVVVFANSALLGLNDGTVQTAFGTNGTGNDTNQANNNETESTAYVTPDANMSVAVFDSPDPALLNGNIDYLVTVANLGPDPTSNASLNLFNNGSLKFVALVPPAGFTCNPPTVGATPTFGCSNPSFAVGASVDFIVTVRSDQNTLGPNGGVVSTSFNVGSGLSDPNNANNNKTEDTMVLADNLFKDGFEG